MTQVRNCQCWCHTSHVAGPFDPAVGVSSTDIFYAKLACAECLPLHDPQPYEEPTAWTPEDEQA